jgi:hypothetical protein
MANRRDEVCGCCGRSLPQGPMPLMAKAERRRREQVVETRSAIVPGVLGLLHPLDSESAAVLTATTPIGAENKEKANDAAKS